MEDPGENFARRLEAAARRTGVWLNTGRFEAELGACMAAEALALEISVCVDIGLGWKVNLG